MTCWVGPSRGGLPAAEPTWRLCVASGGSGSFPAGATYSIRTASHRTATCSLLSVRTRHALWPSRSRGWVGEGARTTCTRTLTGGCRVFKRRLASHADPRPRPGSMQPAQPGWLIPLDSASWGSNGNNRPERRTRFRGYRCFPRASLHAGHCFLASLASASHNAGSGVTLRPTHLNRPPPRPANPGTHLTHLA